jgi:hypothetical protein
MMRTRRRRLRLYVCGVRRVEIGPRRERSLVSGARRMNIKTVIEYKGYRIEVSPVGKAGERLSLRQDRPAR